MSSPRYVTYQLTWRVRFYWFNEEGNDVTYFTSDPFNSYEEAQECIHYMAPHMENYHREIIEEQNQVDVDPLIKQLHIQLCDIALDSANNFKMKGKSKVSVHEVNRTVGNYIRGLVSKMSKHVHTEGETHD